MWRALMNLLPGRKGGRGFAAGGNGRFRDARFVSFLAASNRKTLNTDFQDALLQGRKLVRYALVAVLVCGGAWVLVESAHALSMF